MNLTIVMHLNLIAWVQKEVACLLLNWRPLVHLYLDVDLEGPKPLETFATTKDGHAHNSKKQKNTKIYNMDYKFGL